MAATRPAAQICREADGYRPHLVSPEKGIKRLVQEAMLQTSPYVHKFVDEIHLVLQETVRGRRAVQMRMLPALHLLQLLACCPDGALCTLPIPYRCPPVCCLQVREAARRSVLTEAGISDLASTGGKNMVSTSAVAACCCCLGLSCASDGMAPAQWSGWSADTQPSCLRSLPCRSSCGSRALRTRSSRRPTGRWRSGGRRRTRVGGVGGRLLVCIHSTEQPNLY